MRPCFCDGEGSAPAGLRPIRDFWPLIQNLTIPGELFSLSLRNKNPNRISKAILARMGIDSAGTYPINAFRRGAAIHIMASGPTLAQIVRSTGWHSIAFRVYLLFQMEWECNMEAIFASPNRSKTSKPRAAPNPAAIAQRPRSSAIEIPPGSESPSSSSLSGGGGVGN